MPTFKTPGPISVTIDLGVGDTRITSSDRTDTVVTVRPQNPSKGADIKAAESTRVDYSNGTLRVVTPKGWSRFTPFGAGGAVDVAIELPTDSRIRGESGLGAFDTEGPLGACTFKTGMGDIRLDHVGALHANTGFGEVSVEQVDGDADISTGSGALRVQQIAGGALIKNSNGNTSLGDVGGDVRIKAANGEISVDRTERSVSAKTANGSIRIGEIARGVIDLETAVGAVEFGIREGTAAWLDVSSRHGRIRNSLAAGSDQSDAKDKAEIRARTSFGDIVIGRPPN